MAYDVQFLRGIEKNYTDLASKSDKVFYYTTDTHKLFLGSYELTNNDVQALITALTTRVTGTEGAITTLNGDAETTGSVSQKIATAVANLAAVARTGSAGDVAVSDSDDNFTATNVETVLAEIAGKITASDVNITLEDGSSGQNDYAKVYNLFQTKGGVKSSIGSINIPKDLVVKGGSVESVVTAGTPYANAVVGDLYIDLEIQNQVNHLYIPVNKLTDVYTGSNGVEVNITVTNGTIAATVNDGSIVIGKLSSAVQASLGKADSAVQGVQEGTTNGTIGVKAGSATTFTDVAVHGLGSAAYANTTAFDAAGEAAAVLGTNADAATANTVYGAKAAAAAADAKAAAAQDAISALDVTDTAVSGQYVSAVSQADGQISVSRAALPSANLDASTNNSDTNAVAVVSGVTQVNGAITAIDSVAVDAAGAATTAEANAKAYVDTALSWGAF